MNPDPHNDSVVELPPTGPSARRPLTNQNSDELSNPARPCTESLCLPPDRTLFFDTSLVDDAAACMDYRPTSTPKKDSTVDHRSTQQMAPPQLISPEPMPPDDRRRVPDGVSPAGKDNKNSSAMMCGPIEYSGVIKKLWPYPTSNANREAPIHMDIFRRVRDTNLPNYMAARVIVPSELNCDMWDILLHDYPDREICQFLRFGWPSSYTAPTPPTSTMRNHPSAAAYSAHIDHFVNTEVSKGALLGPFPVLPFAPWTQVSPLMTAPKKDSIKRRVIIDLSFPAGSSVNDGVARNFFQGKHRSYNLPTVHDLAEIVIDQGQGTLMWKNDLERAYRQLRSDPMDYPLMCIRHKGGVLHRHLPFIWVPWEFCRPAKSLHGSVPFDGHGRFSYISLHRRFLRRPP